MKKILSVFVSFLLTVFCIGAPKSVKNVAKCSSADNIVGTYYVEYNGQKSKCKIYKSDNGTFKANCIWLEKDKDSKGNKILDVHNPDKSLRGKPADKILLIWDLKYNPEKKQWDGGTIYDPVHGFTANCTAEFIDDGNTLKIFGNVLGIGKSVYWKFLEK